ncbi:LysR family transcriptional regulator [Burkholderia sp. Nafp2/4-1b]|uniref:LysR family transcriptional regulator n=1 Tax=Burkholderia sp. Nafp2/4-1b TaxID=2116686 RepID=UPI0013CF0AD6|nr:LysR family transcriptional regulator [Burkholderia sp. Nafp2/4-1b]
MTVDLKSLNLNDLYALAQLVQRDSLSAAGRAIGMSRQALGKSISRLEASLGVQILSQRLPGRGVEFTETGQLIGRAAATIFAGLQISLHFALDTDDAALGLAAITQVEAMLVCLKRQMINRQGSGDAESSLGVRGATAWDGVVNET